MKNEILLFTQTMHSLLASRMSLQASLSICSEILLGSKEKKFVAGILKNVNEGKKLSAALLEYGKTFSPFYMSLVAIGEDSGTLADVFGHLTSYLKDKKQMKRKIVQALVYPVLVLVTAVAVVLILTGFVMPRLEGIFEAFTESSEGIGMQMDKIRGRFLMAGIISLLVAVTFSLGAIFHRLNEKSALVIDGLILKVPCVKDFSMTMQMYDFSFAMKLLSSSYFPLVQSLDQAKEVLSNRCIKKSITAVCESIKEGNCVGDSFERETIFPKYLTVWIKIAEENGNTAQAFTELLEYYRNESESILDGITQAAEPVFILITGIIIISVIEQFVIPVFNLLGAL